MSPFRFREEEESSSTGTILGILAGAVAGFAVGMFVAQRVGGFSGLQSKVKSRLAQRRGAAEPLSERYTAQPDEEEFDDYDEDDLETEGYDAGLEDRVLEAFRNDPILAERAIDIGSIGEGIIELAGWVENEDESEHAVTLARGVPGVDTVVNRIALGDEEARFEEAARRAREQDPTHAEGHWEGGGVGTGRRRQGSSDEPDRHSTPKVPLGERWQTADAAIRDAADDVEGLAERRSRAKRAARGDRSGVPKADHVDNPLDTPAD